MAAFALVQSGDFVGRRAQREDADVGAFALDRARHGAVAADVNLLLDLVLEPALGAVEDDQVAFPGVEGVERVAHRDAGVVAHDHVHRVLDVDVRPEHAAVAEIAVVFLVVEVQLLEARVRREVEEERALVLLRAGVAALVMALQAEALGHLRRVELALAGRHDRDRHRGEPPVDEVEVMRGLVDHQAAGVGLVAVPAAEVVRAVDGVEHPVEIHRQHVADRRRSSAGPSPACGAASSGS